MSYLMRTIPKPRLAEGRNLINRRLYEYPWYPELGANFTVGIKANF